MARIRFKFHPGKALAALHLMLQEHGPSDLHTILKACYFADKSHLNELNKPIFGASYRAMRFGPVPLEVYEMAKGESLWLWELGLEQMPWELRGYTIFPGDRRNIDTSCLSESNVEHIREGYRRSAAMNFSQRTDATHGSDWQAAELGMMRYEDMIEDGPKKDELIEYLRGTSKFMRL